LATDVGYFLNKNVVQNLSNAEQIQQLFPQSSSINLSRLTDYAVDGATQDLGEKGVKIWTNEEMNK